MKALALILLLIPQISFSQSNYNKGFNDGYSHGYCYGQGPCVSPVPPVSPIPLVGESEDSYQDGYNRGFKVGLEDQQKNNSVQQQNAVTPATAPDLSNSILDYISNRNSQTIQEVNDNRMNIYQNNIELLKAIVAYILQMENFVRNNSTMNTIDNEYINTLEQVHKNLLSIPEDVLEGNTEYLPKIKQLLIDYTTQYIQQLQSNTINPDKDLIPLDNKK